jgi:CRISPR-associated exonuclease Cas4
LFKTSDPAHGMPPTPVPLSALQHWRYCPRQCGLIHLEQVFDDNVHTLRGQAVHARADQPGVETAKGVRVERALPLWHDALGLIGKSDVVEFLAGGVPYPVEYKHGSRHKAADIAACDDLQLAAQATVPGGHDRQSRQRGGAVLRHIQAPPRGAHHRAIAADVAHTAQAVRQMLASGQLPATASAPDQAARRCKACSLQDRCQPHATMQG